MAQAHLGVSYEQPIGDGYYIRPLVSGDYFVLYSDKYSEHNGGDAFNLNVASSTGKQGSVTGGVAVGTKWGRQALHVAAGSDGRLQADLWRSR